VRCTISPMSDRSAIHECRRVGGPYFPADAIVPSGLSRLPHSVLASRQLRPKCRTRFVLRSWARLGWQSRRGRQIADVHFRFWTCLSTIGAAVDVAARSPRLRKSSLSEGRARGGRPTVRCIPGLVPGWSHGKQSSGDDRRPFLDVAKRVRVPLVGVAPLLCRSTEYNS
jgi:hypothetical protein